MHPIVPRPGSSEPCTEWCGNASSQGRGSQNAVGTPQHEDGQAVGKVAIWKQVGRSLVKVLCQ